MKQINTAILIIGFGKAGKTLAAYLGKKGIRTVLVEQSEKMYGGTCINIGCIPTKAMVLQAERHQPYAEALARKGELTSSLRHKNYQSVDQYASVDVITGKATFLHEHAVRVVLPDGSDVEITAERIFINTGTVPLLPDLPGREQSSRVYTSTTLLEQPVLPERLVIIGGGFISLEFASMYAQFGSQVTILDIAPVFLPREDEDMAAEVRSVLTGKGIEIVNSAHVQRIVPGETTDRIQVSIQGTPRTMEADAILIATGRKAYTEGLNLEAAGVVTDARGFIPVNRLLQTNVAHIWALGDINGGPQFTYISLDDFRIVRDQLFGPRQRHTEDRQHVAFCVFVSPPYAHVGLREKEAAQQNLAYRVVKIPARVVPRTALLQQPEGMLKLLVDPETDQILGCTLFCAEAQELINTVRIAMKAGMTFGQLTNEIYTHPSMTEAFNYFD
ncbi:Pyruvate/2-oxoglutarate dehydrogenase complex, dihydrolipoamide dehydrogenase (E3) component [Catalinimonas alkaloidigena]|uniref:Pyruvate/2-oxoglutarate dehydrogenase complex, dihydrolipoamide dehydrogenase (E3) component n=1 Tax=Catalinimonas alkaloidigena TaxID=1075417 RepID=A0A1G9P4L6_9BACT|nr:FAD-dependent oxidoreductase [Catalinimonas alkaloidigena]SDL93654.1 Pyruvate/2-oxoglutarate dehydrogenase complex, dihydrolipoamide dehydrogenase (E3) component [Catalinimonas alkaloidigena]